MVGPKPIIYGFVGLLAVMGCQVTHVQAKVADNPLERIADRAGPKYQMAWTGDDRLELRDNWIVYSIEVIGWGSFHANLHYEDGILHGEFYTRAISPLFLFIPIYQPTATSFDWSGVDYRRRARILQTEILSWAGLVEDGWDESIGRKK